MSWRSLALSSLLLLTLAAAAETRPRYGGVLRVEIATAVSSLDPLLDARSPAVPLLYDTLVAVDDDGQVKPALAVAWQQESDRRLRLTLRHGVTFSDGSAMTPAAVVNALRAISSDWTVTAGPEAIAIDTAAPSPGLLAQLALPQNSIVLRSGQKIFGTGVFSVKDWQPGVKLTLQARQDSWQPRPFVDSLEFLFARSLRDRSTDFDLDRADFIELALQGPAKSGTPIEPGHVLTSEPAVLWALRFSHTGIRDPRGRQAVASAVDRDAIANGILQKRGEPTAGLLPNWITGYSFLFSTATDLPRARQLRAAARVETPLTLVFRAADPLARLIAERVALNLADAGFTVRTAPDTQNIAVPDMELLSVPLASANAVADLTDVTTLLGLQWQPAAISSPTDEYASAIAALKDSWAVPIVYVPVTFGVSARVHGAVLSPSGKLNLPSVWLDTSEARPR